MKKSINGRVNNYTAKFLKYLPLLNSPFLSFFPFPSLLPSEKHLTENARQSKACISECKAKVLEMVMSGCRVCIYTSRNSIIQICCQAEEDGQEVGGTPSANSVIATQSKSTVLYYQIRSSSEGDREQGRGA